MNYENYFEDMFESIPVYRKIVLLIPFMKNDSDFLNECGFSKNDICRFNQECKNLLLEQIEVYLTRIKNEEKSITERIPNK